MPRCCNVLGNFLVSTTILTSLGIFRIHLKSLVKWKINQLIKSRVKRKNKRQLRVFYYNASFTGSACWLNSPVLNVLSGRQDKHLISEFWYQCYSIATFCSVNYSMKICSGLTSINWSYLYRVIQITFD